MAKTLVETSKDDRVYLVHSASIDNGSTSIGGVAIPKFETLEELAEVVEEGFLTEKEACSLLHQQWAIREQAKERSAKSPKAKLTDIEILTLLSQMTPEEKEQCGDDLDKQLAVVKGKKKASLEKGDFDSSAVRFVTGKNAS